MRKYIFATLFFLNSVTAFADEKDSLHIRLNQLMNNKGTYSQMKEQKILQLKQILNVGNLLPEQIYDINHKLYEEYRKYQSDSAVHYVLKNQEITRRLNLKGLRMEADLQLAWLYLIKGMYIESLDLLENTPHQDLPEKLLPVYYETLSTFYSQYNNATYFIKSGLYRDSMLSVLDTLSLQYRINYAAKMVYDGQNAEKELLSLLNETTDQNPERAIIAYLLGYTYKQLNNMELREYYFTMSAITDLENCIRENASFLELALIYEETGNVDQAHRFMQCAVEDAIFCNIYFRISKASSYYAFINDSFQKKEKKQKANLQKSLLAVSILLILLVVGIVHIYLQMKRLSYIRKELYHTNQRLSQLNNKLSSANDRLNESNLIKEEYIAHFFDLCSTYIDKLENYRKTLNKYASNRQIEELFRLLRSTSLIDNELEELYRKFDIIFINLYPSFVEGFNALQNKDGQIVLKQGELLNTELRIFALIRLGITDSMKIAGFLRYSISTIYNYRVKARNNAIVPRDQFEEMVMKIGKNPI